MNFVCLITIGYFTELGHCCFGWLCSQTLGMFDAGKFKSVATATNDCKEILDFLFNYYSNALVYYLENVASPILCKKD